MNRINQLVQGLIMEMKEFIVKDSGFIKKEKIIAEIRKNALEYWRSEKNNLLKLLDGAESMHEAFLELPISTPSGRMGKLRYNYKTKKPICMEFIIIEEDYRDLEVGSIEWGNQEGEIIKIALK